MTENKGKGPVYDPGLCRCCGTMKKCRVLNMEYLSLGQKEVYSDMIMDCFGLVLSYLDGKPSERLICATCVSRLREAASFRKQVLQCEEAFLQMKIYDENQQECDAASKTPSTMGIKVEIEAVKTEPPETCNSPEHDSGEPLESEEVESKPTTATVTNEDSTSNDDIPLKSIAKRKSSPVAQTPPAKKICVKNNIVNVQKKMDQKLAPKVPMSKVQQMIRDRDPAFVIETNAVTIIENSFVCPFKCKHSHLLCFYCGELFADPILMRAHTEEAHNPNKFRMTDFKDMLKLDVTRIDCRLCPAKITTLDEFKKHITSVHNKKFYFKARDFILPFRLTKEDMKCAICDKSFPYFHALNKHMNDHFRNYICETCGLGFLGLARFLMHQSRHEEGVFPCETCGKVFKAQFNKDLHVDRVHNKNGRVYCPKCDIRLMSYHSKLKHLIQFHGEAPMQLPCDLCDRVFDSRRKLTLHKRKDHLKDYRHECQICGQKFFNRSGLTNHMPTHTGERNFKCKICEKSYPRLKTLKDHMRIHNNDRRYRCHICGQAFIQNCSLKGHMKSQHPEYG